MKRALIPLLILLIGAGTPALSTWLYFSEPPEARTSSGELIGPAPLPPTMTANDGSVLAAGDLSGKWVLAHVDEARCAGETCRKKMCLLRFLSRSRPDSKFRTERLFWASGPAPVPPKLEAMADCGRGFDRLAAATGAVDMLDGVRVARFEPHVRAWLRDAAGPEPEGHIYLIDPQGNLMMRYDRDADPYLMAKDFKRLLKLSRSIGG